ncbi:YncE family protein [Actinoplanes sp. DH11]|uniref:YncE family protein n=1 Tax=Actinoplanes sp. DH11 TaxID=2857011 RepID=UPI001E4F7070|nr:hypothetical protein [Actinoplanes sp. DH11]
MIDDLLRAAVRDLADESGTPSGLAAGALARGRRIRRNRRAATAAAALAAVLAVTVPFVARHDRDVRPEPLPAATPTVVRPSFDPAEVFVAPGGARLLSIEERRTTRVLDPHTGRYRDLPDRDLAPVMSPDERHVAVHRAGEEGVRILDLKTGDHWRPPVSTPAYLTWSDDGSRLLLSHNDGFTVLDPAARRSRTHQVDLGRLPCLDHCRFTWHAGNTRVALPQAWARNDEEQRISGLAVFDAASGEFLRNVPIKGIPAGPNAWSPDGRLVLVRLMPQSADQVTIVEAESGRAVGHFTAVWSRFLGDSTVLAQNAGILTRYDGDATVLDKAELPAELTGRLLTFGF